MPHRQVFKLMNTFKYIFWHERCLFLLQIPDNAVLCMKAVRILTTVFALSLCSWANATLIGDQVLIEQNRTALGTLRDDLVTVGGGVELSCPGAFELCSANIPGFSGGSIDIGISTILFDLGTITSANFTTDTFNGYIFSDLDWTDGPGEILGVSLITDVDGLDLTRVSFGTDFVAVNFSALSLDADDTFFELALDVSHDVPEPSTIGLLGAGLLGLGFIRRRQSA